MKCNQLDFAKLIVPSSESIVTSLPHIRQIRNWDCGIACLRMVLGLYNPSYYSNDDVDVDVDDGGVSSINLSTFGIKTSVWTIDLAAMLWHYGVMFTFCTAHIGIETSYEDDEFYKRCWDDDKIRVQKLFEEAEGKGIAVENRVVETAELLEHLDCGGVAIVLVDWSLMHCIKCRRNFSDQLRKCTPKAYAGHYIVVCGYDKASSIVYFKNPAVSVGLCGAPLSMVNEARHAWGTDDDIILVHRNLTFPTTTTAVIETS